MSGFNGNLFRTRTEADAKLFMKQQQDRADRARSPRMNSDSASKLLRWLIIMVGGLVIATIAYSLVAATLLPRVLESLG